jgi:hypothetical protein
MDRHPSNTTTKTPPNKRSTRIVVVGVGKRDNSQLRRRESHAGLRAGDSRRGRPATQPRNFRQRIQHRANRLGSRQRRAHAGTGHAGTGHHTRQRRRPGRRPLGRTGSRSGVGALQPRHVLRR